MQWEEIISARQQTTGDSDVWTPLTHAFQTLDFKFLNNVDPGFAYKLKEEGRLGGFRNYLRRVWHKIESENTPAQNDSAARAFSDELHEEHQKAKEDWAKIDKSILEWGLGATGISAVFSPVLSPVITGGLDWMIPSLGFSIAGVQQLISARYKRREFRANVPLAVFLDLEKKNKLLK